MDHSRHWLAENSPYRPPLVKKQQFSQTQCCGECPEPAGLEVRGQHPPNKMGVWFPVYQCQICGKRYLWLDGKGKRLDSLLKYEVRTQHRNP